MPYSQLHLGLFSTSDPRSARSWSGVPPFMLRALDKICGGVQPLVPFADTAMRFSHLYSRKIGHLTGAYEPAYLNSVVTRMSRARLRAILEPSKIDAVVGAAASTLMGAVPKRIPAIYVSDATFRLLHEYYQHLSDLPLSIAKRAERFEQEAIDRADKLVYSSEWAANSAIAHYDASPRKITVVPFGASLPSMPPKVNRSAPKDRVRLLLAGGDWHRKGADIAVAATIELRRKGINATLTIVGCAPPDGASLPPFVNSVPFLSKSDPAELEQWVSFFRTADFFILPTRAECTPIVFCEAAAYGLPVISTDTGGVGGVLLDDITGCLLPEAAQPSHYAERIAYLIRQPDQYQRMARNARRRFEDTLNWDAWAKRIMEVARPLI